MHDRTLLTAALTLSALVSRLDAQCPNGSGPPCAADRAPTRTPDPNVIAVIPFRVTGADSALAEGLAEVLAAEFTGEGVPRAADPGLVWRAWHGLGGSPTKPFTQAAALQVARQVGAGLVLTGSAVGFSGRLTFNATISNAPSGTRLSRSDPVTGREDSLPVMLRQLTTSLLAGSSAQVIAAIGRAGTLSPEAMRAWLAGRTIRRRNGGGERDFTRAIELDSTFALAALSRVAGLTVGSDSSQRRAWSLRDRLSAADRALLVAYVGPNYPNASPLPEQLAAMDEAAGRFPDNADLRYRQGDTYHHFGVALGIRDAPERANRLLLQSITSDSMLALSLLHLVFEGVTRGDTASVRRYGTRLLSGGGYTPWARWFMALASRQPREVDRVVASLDSAAFGPVGAIAYSGVWDSTGMANADRVLAVAARLAKSEADRRDVRGLKATVERNRGRPKAAHAAFTFPDAAPDTDGVYAWLYGDGDSATAASAVELLQPIADAPPATPAADQWPQYGAICVVEQWRLWRGDTTGAQRAIERLASAAPPADSANTVERARLCAKALTALRAVRGNLPDAAAAVTALDSAVWGGTNISTNDLGQRLSYRVRHTMLLAKLHELRGDIPGALRTIRRRCQAFSFPHAQLLAPSLREEGRLAALTGDRDGAIKAYRWYLTLVTDPEPAIVPTRDRVKAELARLVNP